MWNFRDLEVWKESKTICKACYEYCNQFPEEEKFNIISQIKRASVSVPLNLAEGCSRSSSKDFGRFIEIAIGSYFELETVLELGYELYPTSIEYPSQLIEAIQIQEKRLQRLRQSTLAR